MDRLATLLDFLRDDPDDPFTRFAIAQEYAKSGRDADAAAAYAALVRDRPDYVGTYYHLGAVYRRLNRPADAEATYQTGIAKHPDGPLCHVNYGLMLVRKSDVDNAVKQLSAVLKPAEVNYNIASVYSELGRKDLAQFYYKRSLQCDPGFVPARQKLAAVE